MAQTQTIPVEMLEAVPQLRLVEEPVFEVIPVAERLEDQWSRHRAERIFAKAGEVALSSTVEVATVPETPVTLYDAIQRGAEGDLEAQYMVRSNAHTEAVEILYKAEHVTQATIKVDKQGRTTQFGQTAEDMTLNTLRHASHHEAILPRSQAETRNSMRIEDLNREGLLDDNYFVVVSLCLRGVTDKQLDELNFFSETYSMTIQATTKTGEDELTLESAFVAGITQKDGEHQRHDLAATEKFGEKLSVDLSGLDGAELIDFALLVPKGAMPDGVVNLAELMDEAIEEVVGEPVFYGQAKPKQDYVAHREICRQREAELEVRVDRSVAALLAEASDLQGPTHATERLNKVVEAEMLQVATEDHTIDARVFGCAGAQELQVARSHWINGDMLAVQSSLFRAAKVARSGSCPAARQTAEESSLHLEGGKEQEADNALQDGNCPEVKDGDKVNCPFCKKKVKAIVPGNEEIFCSNSDCTAAHSSVKKK